MAGAIWDMITEGDDAGQLLRPLTYTTTAENATRVRVWLKLATPLGAYKLGPSEGLDIERLLQPDTPNAERVAYVRELVLADEGVDSVIGEPTVDITDGLLDIRITLRTTSGAVLNLET